MDTDGVATLDETRLLAEYGATVVSSQKKLLAEEDDVPSEYIKDKNEKRNTWFGLSIFYKRYELLITGCIVGGPTAQQLNPFLGSGVSFTSMISNSQRTTTTIIVRQNKTTFLARERNLKSWTKNPSAFKWAAISRTFAEKGFHTTDQLRITNSRNKTANLISFVLSCICRNTFTQNDHRTMIRLLADVHSLQATIKKIAQLKRSIMKKTPKYNFSVINILIDLEKNIDKAPRNVIDVEAAVALSSKLYC